MSSDRKLKLADISDLRAYEREREEFRTHVKELKRRRRVHVGPFVTLVFENRDTVRFQIQEMARVEKIISDEGIQAELDVYNSLVPEPGQLAATLFIELTSEEDLRLWLPELVGIEGSVELRVGSGDQVDVHRCIPEEAHAAQLTREEITASVHYIYFTVSPDQIERFRKGPVVLAITHPRYEHETELSAATIEELYSDLAG